MDPLSGDDVVLLFGADPVVLLVEFGFVLEEVCLAMHLLLAVS
jgi:hypothetical protein